MLFLCGVPAQLFSIHSHESLFMNPSSTAEDSLSTGVVGNTRLVTLFIVMLSSVLLLFAVSIGAASYFLKESNDALVSNNKEIATRKALTDSANHLSTARLIMIHAAFASRVNDTALFQADVAAARGMIAQSQSSFDRFIASSRRSESGTRFNEALTRAYTAYRDQGITPMMAATEAGQFEDVLALESATLSKLELAYRKPVSESSAFRTAQANEINEHARANASLGYLMMALAGEIASASDEQSRGITQVSQAVSEMDSVTQQNASLVQEASAAAASLEAQAARLTQSVAVFRLNGRHSAPPARPVSVVKSARTVPVRVPETTGGRTGRVNDSGWETF